MATFFSVLPNSPTRIAEHLPVDSTVLDGEIGCLAEDGRPNFRDLLFGSSQPSS
jgi:hypothetical protein